MSSKVGRIFQASKRSALTIRCTYELCSRFGGLGRALLLVGGMQIEIDAAQRPVGFCLAQDDRNLAVESDAVAKMRTAIFVGFDRLLHEGAQRAFTVVGGFVHANDIFLER